MLDESEQRFYNLSIVCSIRNKTTKSEISEPLNPVSVRFAPGTQIASETEIQIKWLHVLAVRALSEANEPQGNELLLQVIILNCLHFVPHCSQLF